MQVGVTERGDAGLDLSWVSQLKPATIIISKNLTQELKQALLANQNCIILHLTCTGFGGSVLEPNVPDAEENLNRVNELIATGFPTKQIVLRIDPVIPTVAGIKTARRVLELFAQTGITRVRYSFMDMYPHVLERFSAAGIVPPYTSFTAPVSWQWDAIELFKQYEDIYVFEACAESTPHKLECVSKKDFDILGLETEVLPCTHQRRTCLCAGNKVELLTSKHRCPHQCLYCYWRD